MGDSYEKDAFYVVRKGDIIGIYKNFADCQAQAAFSPLDSSISVYKGYGLSKEMESYLISNGLQQASFSISATDVQDELFGVLAVCPFQDAGESRRSAQNPPNQHIKLDNYIEPQTSVGPACASIPASSRRNEKHDAGESSRSALNPPNESIKLENYVESQTSVGHAFSSFPASNRRNEKHNAGGSSRSALNLPNQPIKLENYMEPQSNVGPACASFVASNRRNEKHPNPGLNIFPTNPQQNCDVSKNIKPVNQIHPSCASGPSSFLSNPQKRVTELRNYMEPQDVVHPVSVHQSCMVEFDGASKGNPGLAGAGAILRAIDGNEVWLLREGVGIATNNVAEYRSIILGLRTALQKGFKHVKVRGDSPLVCNQILGKWKTKNENMANLCQKALQLKKQFLTFTIEHVAKELNSAADAQANRAVNLRDGQIEMEQYHA